MTQAISLTLVLRIETPNEPGAFGMLANAIGDAGNAPDAPTQRSRLKIVE